MGDFDFPGDDGVIFVDWDLELAFEGLLFYASFTCQIKTNWYMATVQASEADYVWEAVAIYLTARDHIFDWRFNQCDNGGLFRTEITTVEALLGIVETTDNSCRWN